MINVLAASILVLLALALLAPPSLGYFISAADASSAAHTPKTVAALNSSFLPQLAKRYDEVNERPVSDYLVSEKFDGIRALWTGSALVTRRGNIIRAPHWFTAALPNTRLDGELWTKHQDFETLSSIVRRQTPDARWRQVRYMVFDMPDAQTPFAERYRNYQQLIQGLKANPDAPHVHAVPQYRFNTASELDAFLQAKLNKGAEGVMLNRASDGYHSGRSDALLKLKPYFDAEAEVIAHLPGRGKYEGMLGALRVRGDNGVEFSVGTGFTDEERANPPPIGSIVTFQYHGYTKHGLPRFTSFLRVRDDSDD